MEPPRYFLCTQAGIIYQCPLSTTPYTPARPTASAVSSSSNKTPGGRSTTTNEPERGNEMFERAAFQRREPEARPGAARKEHPEPRPRQSSTTPAPARGTEREQQDLGLESDSEPRGGEYEQEQPIPRNAPAARTITYEQVLRGVQDDDYSHHTKHMIVKYPSLSDGEFYILHCDEHGLNFGARPFQAAGRHVDSLGHGRAGRSNEVAIEILGWRVLGCDDRLAAECNDEYSRALEQGYQPRSHAFRGDFRRTTSRPITKFAAWSSMAGQGQGQDSTTPQGAASINSGVRSRTRDGSRRGIMDPKPGHIYQGRFVDRDGSRWYYVAILPVGCWKRVGIKGHLLTSQLAQPRSPRQDTKEQHEKKTSVADPSARADASCQSTQSGVPNQVGIEQQPRQMPKLKKKLPRIPSCYKVSTSSKYNKICGWEKGFEDGGPRAMERKFPCLYMESCLDIPPPGRLLELSDDCSVLGWIDARNLRERDFEQPPGEHTRAFLSGQKVAHKFEALVEAARSNPIYVSSGEDSDEEGSSESQTASLGRIPVRPEDTATDHQVGSSADVAARQDPDTVADGLMAQQGSGDGQGHTPVRGRTLAGATGTATSTPTAYASSSTSGNMSPGSGISSSSSHGTFVSQNPILSRQGLSRSVEHTVWPSRVAASQPSNFWRNV